MRIACSTYVYIKSEASPATMLQHLTCDISSLVFVRISKWLGLLAVQCQRRNIAEFLETGQHIDAQAGSTSIPTARYLRFAIEHLTLKILSNVQSDNTGGQSLSKFSCYSLIDLNQCSHAAIEALVSVLLMSSGIHTQDSGWCTLFSGKESSSNVQADIGWDLLSLHCMRPVCIRLDRQMYGSNWSSSIQFTIQNRTLKILKRIQYLHSKIACGQSLQSFMGTMLI